MFELIGKLVFLVIIVLYFGFIFLCLCELFKELCNAKYFNHTYSVVIAYIIKNPYRIKPYILIMLALIFWPVAIVTNVKVEKFFHES